VSLSPLTMACSVLKLIELSSAPNYYKSRTGICDLDPTIGLQYVDYYP